MDVFMRLQPAHIQTGVIVVGQDELPGPLLHVSTNPNIKAFVPSVTQRTGLTENRSVARVSTAPTLLGCLIGYVQGWDNFYWPEAKKNGSLLQKWTVYRFDTPLSLLPNTKLLFDQKQTDERWLVGYSSDTMSYTPIKTARGFYKDVLLVGRPDKVPFKIMTVLVEVLEDTLLFSKNIKLTKGFWEIRGPEPTGNVRSWESDKLYTVKQISRAEYDYVPPKEYLSMEEFVKPPFMSW
ncbi:hypothetical protein FDI21_gp128 [Pseudomonas phage Noxifer]|uniref:Uncharacterized protein n=1 Tax=Pseudomonas phage Noxifer TaxID=2006684 RepID=A0A1Y0T346_9CAUD|nr:hypothetical protein FDI21_gp128 [Pseudomonas phage Noxifer]ARV77297.1 hypothetical protein NOXIFER_128 [Pseudomonas phage Noxifer]